MSTRRGSWLEVLSARGTSNKPWLLLPTGPQRDDQHRSVSYRELGDAALRITSGLQALGGRPGDRVVIVADNGAEAALLLLGSLMSGLMVVPVPPRGISMRGLTWQKYVSRICADCDPSFVVGSERSLPERTCTPRALFRSFEDLLGSGGTPEAAPAVPGSAPALIQYTSGTTARPRGVVLTHDNVLHNVWSIGNAIGASSSDVGVSWLPLFHDMGLIGGLLFATYWGMPVVLLTPRSFQMRPHSWLWAIARFRGTCSVAPNSAYHLCASKIPDRHSQGLDLSSWRVAFTGSELVHPETLQLWNQRFGRHGFRREATFPVYGLAENTVAATFPPFGREPRIDLVSRRRLETDGRACPAAPDDSGRRAVVSVGQALPGQRLRIVARATGARVPERVVGRIELSGRCVMRGYWKAPAESEVALSADGWLRTGDLGYVADGELYVVGREKHVIKRAGRTHNADEIRSVVLSVEGIRGGAVAAFGVADERTGTELLVVLAETRLRDPRERAALELAIARRVQAELSVRPDVVELLRRGAIPRTTSGKVQVALARARHWPLRHGQRPEPCAQPSEAP